ncbi:MAG: ABC transporter substrate-binding protein [Pseudomonadota bacterium]
MKPGTIIKGLFVILIMVLMAVLSFSNVSAEKKKAFKEGIIHMGSMTGMTGAYAGLGTWQMWGAMDRINYQNDELGGIEGHKIEHLWADMKTDVATCISLYKRWSKEKPKPVEISVGHSSAIHALKPDFEKDEILSVTWNWNVPQIVPAGWLYWPMPGYADSMVAFGRWLKENWDYSKKGVPKVGYLRWDHPYGFSQAIIGNKYCEQQGWLKKIGEEIVPMGALNVTTQLTRLAAKNPDFIVTSVLSSMSVALKDAKKMGLLDKIQFVAAVYDTGRPYLKAAGEAAEGVLGIFGCAFTNETTLPGISLMTKVFQKYHAPKTEIEDEFSYIVGWLISDTTIEATKRAIKKVGYEKMTNKDVKAAIESIKDYDTGGITHPLTFGEGSEGRRGNKYSRICKAEKGAWKVISPWYEVPFLKGD